MESTLSQSISKDALTSPERVRATLRIYHPDLAPEKIAEALRLSPTVAWKSGEEAYGFRKLPGHFAPSGGFLLSSRLEVKSNKPEAHINYILEQVSSSLTALKILQKQGFMIDLVVAWHTLSDHTRPQLSPAIMRKLGRLGIPIWFDIYVNEKENLSKFLSSTTPLDAWANFRVYHAELKPEEVSALLDLEPSQVWLKGDTIHLLDNSTRTAKTSGWLLSSYESLHDHSLNQHLKWLLTRLKGTSKALKYFRKRDFHIDVCLSWLANSSNTCPALTPEVMLTLGNLDIPACFDVYLTQD